MTTTQNNTPDREKFTVWVGGIADAENITLEKAQQIQREWIEQGYDDAVIEHLKG